MPVQECTIDRKPGFRWGETGACYTYTPGDMKGRARARLKAETQGYAIRKSQERAGEEPEKVKFG